MRVVAQLDENDALPAFEELLATRALQELPSTARYGFAHDKIRDVVRGCD